MTFKTHSILLLHALVTLFWECVECSGHPITPIQQTTLPTNNALIVRLQTFARYRANDSHIGQSVPCTHDEEVCFRYNLIFDPKTDKCVPLGEGGHGCFLRASRQEFEHGSGHIVGVCQKYDDPCNNGLRYRMAYDGRCYDQNVGFDALCGCQPRFTMHFLGGWECRCSSSDPIQVEQPEEDGHCLIPDFRNPYLDRAAFYDQPLKTMDKYYVDLNCTTEQRRCFEQEKVWVDGASGCHSLLKQGPCPEEHVVAMDGRATVQGRAEATCVHVRGGCPQGQKRVAFDGECYDERDIDIAAPGAVQMNAYGVHEVLYFAKSLLYTPQIKNDQCGVESLHIWPPIGFREYREPPPCGPDDMSQCSLLEIFSTPPPPESI